MLLTPLMPRVWLPPTVPLAVLVIAAATWWPRPVISAASVSLPQVRLTKTIPVALPGESDSNSPAFWDLVDGINQLHVLNSAGARTYISRGRTLDTLGSPQRASCTTECDGRRWLEAVLQDDDGTLYGYYHGEPNPICIGAGKTAPRIGAARSRDGGYTWADLGILLEAPAGSERCDSPNQYFVGGVGDFSVILDERQTDVYFFFSKYFGEPSEQGIAVARMLWAGRDTPHGQVDLWDAGIWRPATRSTSRALPQLADADPIYPVSQSWHDETGRVDAFWGPSVHWNTYLEQYVMLLNRSIDASWKQEGIYVSFSPVLDDSARWSVPYKILNSDSWYPQVIGLEPGVGTDKLAGQTARLFVQGRSEHFITFERPR